MVDHCHLPFNASVQGVSGSGLEMVVDPMDATLRRTISAPVTVPQTFIDSSSLSVSSLLDLIYLKWLKHIHLKIFDKATTHTANSASNMGG